jgi:hypothetical protein
MDELKYTFFMVSYDRYQIFKLILDAYIFNVEKCTKVFDN